MRQRTFIPICISLLLLTSFQVDAGLEKFKMKIQGTKFFMDIPQGYKQTRRLINGHGEGYYIIYPDSSLIYFTNDRYVPTPNHVNLATIKWKPQPGKTHDTALYGQSGDGKCWKEIQMKGKSLGYLNVSAGKKDLFDHSLRSLRPRKTKNVRL